MTADATRSWLALVLVVGGYAIGVALWSELELGRDLAQLAGVVGAAAGYGAWRLIPPPTRRGPPRYWRGRAYWD